jgi:integrase
LLEDGRPIDKSKDYDDWTQLLQRAGVRHVRLHDGRHTAATLLLTESVHPRVVMELLGHSQIRTTLDIYSHVMPALAREAADRMGALLLAQPTATTIATTEAAGPGRSEESPDQRGGAEGTRTPDPHTASVVRYQLRHSPLRPGLVRPNRWQLYRAARPRRRKGVATSGTRTPPPRRMEFSPASAARCAGGCRTGRAGRSRSRSPGPPVPR